jgi:diguanylate cyclase (GGDEF)-like protein
MSDYKHDARFKELQFLAKFVRDRWVTERFPKDGSFETAKDRQMVLSLILRGMLNGPDVLVGGFRRGHASAAYEIADSMDRYVSNARAELIESLLQGADVHLEMGHLGRLRLFELQEQLRATRLREAFGILYDGRYVERDLSVAIMNSRTDESVSLAYLDMNGLKAFNEDGDHATGDTAIKAFFHAIETAVSDAGDAYRKGGDEVVVIMPGIPLEEARQRMRGALISLAREEVSVKGEPRKLSSACGLLSVNSPQAQAEAEIQRADHLQKKAKAASKIPDGSRRSALIVQDADVELI